MIAAAMDSHQDIDRMHTKASHNGRSREQRTADEAASLVIEVVNAVKKQKIDRNLLADKRPEVVSLACRKLPTDTVVPLFKALLSMTRSLEREPYVVHWTKSVLLAHAANFKAGSANGDLSKELYTEVNEQLEAWSQTLPLEGRLDLIQDRIAARLAFAAGVDESEDDDQSSDEDESESEDEEEIMDINDMDEGSAHSSNEESHEDYDDDDSVDLEKSDEEDV